MKCFIPALSLIVSWSVFFAPLCVAQSRVSEPVRPIPQALMMGNSASVMTGFFSAPDADAASIVGVVRIAEKLSVDELAPLAPAIQAGAVDVMNSEIPGVKLGGLAPKLAALAHPALLRLLPIGQQLPIKAMIDRRKDEISPQRKRLLALLEDIADRLRGSRQKAWAEDETVRTYSPGSGAPVFRTVPPRPTFALPAEPEKTLPQPARAAKPLPKLSSPVPIPARPTPRALMAAKSSVVMTRFFTAAAPDVASVAGVVGIADKLPAAELEALLPSIHGGIVGVMRLERSLKSDVLAARLAVLTHPSILRLLTAGQRLGISAMGRRHRSEIAPYSDRLKAILKDAAGRISRHPSEFKPPVLIKS